MATCARESGFLFWKKRCDRPSIGPCDECRLFVCQMHGGIQGDGGLMCHACLHTEDQEDSDSGLSWSSGSSSSDSASGISIDSGSSSSDSGGGGDSGGSSSD